MQMFGELKCLVLEHASRIHANIEVIAKSLEVVTDATAVIISTEQTVKLKVSIACVYSCSCKLYCTIIVVTFLS